MSAIETFQHNGKTIEIHHDSDCESPRHDDNLGTFWTQTRNYKSPDKMPAGANVFETVAREFGCVGLVESMEKALDRDAVWLKVWKYEHSGIAYRAADSNPFQCPWDSGQVGYIFARKEAVRKEYGVTRITPAIRLKALDVLRGEVGTYSQWANGETYGFRVLDAEGEEEDSCWGFIGMDYCKEAAMEAA